jgi:hypothetical protein
MMEQMSDGSWTSDPLLNCIRLRWNGIRLARGCPAPSEQEAMKRLFIPAEDEGGAAHRKAKQECDNEGRRDDRINGKSARMRLTDEGRMREPERYSSGGADKLLLSLWTNLTN